MCLLSMIFVTDFSSFVIHWGKISRNGYVVSYETVQKLFEILIIAPTKMYTGQLMHVENIHFSCIALWIYDGNMFPVFNIHNFLQ